MSEPSQLTMAHSNVMGGSTAERRIQCIASYRAEAAAPKEEESEFAARGSMLHAAMELLLASGIGGHKKAERMYKEMLGQDLGFEGQEITQELIDEKIRPAWLAWEEMTRTLALDDWFIEQKVSYGTIAPGAFGTADVIAKDVQGNLHIIDWKFGDGVMVPVVGNMALGFYAGGALYDEDPELKAFCSDINDKVFLHIIQPRTGASDESPLKTWETTVTWVEDLVDMIADAVTAAKKDDAPFKAGKWCQFCRAKPTCPHLRGMASDAIAKAPKSMTAVELGAAMQMASVITSWANDIFKMAQKEMEAGATVPGFKLVNKRPSRVWADPVEAELLMRKHKKPVKDIFESKLISPAKAEKLDKQLYSKLLSDIVVMHSSGLTVVPDSDKRPAVDSGAALLAAALPKQ